MAVYLESIILTWEGIQSLSQWLDEDEDLEEGWREEEGVNSVETIEKKAEKCL